MLVVLSVAILVAAIPGKAEAQARHGTIDIAITVPSADSVHVEERYFLTSSPAELRVLTRPCAAIVNMRIERGGIALNFVESRDWPWITLRDTTAADTLPFVVRYDVRLTGTGSIPLVHLAAPLARNGANPLGAVSVEVELSDDASRVAFPHMTRQAGNQWTAHYVGVPSFVEISDRPASGCAEPPVDGDNGGLVWRFLLLVGIMVAWVPIYLTWARRTGESA